LIKATMISTGSTHSCAVTTAGGIKCWGYNGGPVG
jgi:alpha-tubulin suppressor-like RCC1 family protein